MALSRVIKLTGAAYGGSPTSIEGVREVSFTINYQFGRGQSDGEIGPTTFDLVGMETTGTIIVENYDQARILLALSAGALVYQYRVQAGTARTRTFDNVTYTDAGPVTIPQEPGDGPTQAYAIAWKGVFAAADADIDDHIALAGT